MFFCVCFIDNEKVVEKGVQDEEYQEAIHCACFFLHKEKGKENIKDSIYRIFGDKWYLFAQTLQS